MIKKTERLPFWEPPPVCLELKELSKLKNLSFGSYRYARSYRCKRKEGLRNESDVSPCLSISDEEGGDGTGRKGCFLQVHFAHILETFTLHIGSAIGGGVRG